MLQKPGKFKTHFFGTSEVRRGNCIAEEDSQVYLHIICLTYGPYQFSLTSVPYATAAENTWLWPPHPAFKRQDRLGKEPFAGFGTVVEGITESGYTKNQPILLGPF